MKLIFLGPPGAGKGTQAARVSVKLGVPHISTGDILRAAIKNGTKVGLEAKAYIDAGALVPDEVIMGIIKERLEQDDCKNGFLFDGFPRTIAQAEALRDISPIDAVVDIDVSDEALIRRLSGRRVCLSCGGTYHIEKLNGKTDCSACGAALSQRQDDQADTVLNRLTVYHKQTAPLIDFYQKQGILKTVDGSKGYDEVFEDIGKVLEGNA